jgi:transcriptional regulator with XRE-family HTH domain
MYTIRQLVKNPMFSDKTGPKSPRPHRRFSIHLQRVMDRHGLTVDELARRSGLDDQTLRELLRDDVDARPPMPTLQQLAAGLGCDVHELSPPPPAAPRRQFDRRTNPIVDEVIAKHPRWFDGWTLEDFDDLYSRFGTGGALTWDGAVASVRTINLRREMLAKVTLLLETGEAEVLVGMIHLMYGKVILCGGSTSRLADGASGAGVASAENGVLHLDDAPRSTVGFGNERPDDGVLGQPGRRKVPTHVARKVQSVG